MSHSDLESAEKRLKNVEMLIARAILQESKQSAVMLKSAWVKITQLFDDLDNLSNLSDDARKRRKSLFARMMNAESTINTLTGRTDSR